MSLLTFTPFLGKLLVCLSSKPPCLTYLNPTSLGELFTIDAGDFYRDVVPTTPLDSNHPFGKFWQEFLAKLSNGCDPFWDAMMRIYIGQVGFAGNRSEMELFKAIFLRRPPNIAIADMQSRKLYGRHKPLPRLWGFIFISKFFVDEWVAAGDDIAAISYEAILKATIVHEVAHWAQTLRVGLYPPGLTKDQFDHLPPTELLNMKKEMTPKRFRTFASGAAGEAGYYVEVAVFGGILTFQKDKLIIVTSKAVMNMVSIDSLRELKNLGLCQLVSPAASPSATLFPSLSPIHNRQRTSTMLHDSDDEELEDKDSDDEDLEELLPKHCPREYPMLDVIAAQGLINSNSRHQ